LTSFPGVNVRCSFDILSLLWLFGTSIQKSETWNGPVTEEEQIKPSSKKVSGSQNDLKQTSALVVLPVLPWAFYWLSGVAAQSLQKHVLDSSW